MSAPIASPPPVTRALAGFIHALGCDSLPPVVRAQMAVTLVDFFRVGCAGLAMPWVGKLRAALMALGGKPVASVLFSDQRLDPVRAAYLNGVIAGSLEWDDTHVGAMLHPGVVVWPAVLAVGEAVSAPGRDLVAAAAAGYETMIRVGLGVQPSHFRRGFQSTATCGVFGAAAAAAKLLGLGPDGIRDALGVAASYAGGVTQFFLSGSDVKRLHAGKASAAGVEAALLARAGLTGPHDAIEGAQGFARALADAFDPGLVLDGLGERFLLLGLQLKPHAVSARMLAAIEAAEALARRGARAEAVEAIEIGVPAVVLGRLTLNDPDTLQQAQLSAPFAVALALVLAAERPAPLVLGVDDFASHVDDARVRDLARRTTCVVDAEIDAGLTAEYGAARVTLRLAAGGTMEEKVMLPTGCWKRPMGADEIAARFRVVAAPVVGAAAIDPWLAKAGAPDRVSGAAELMTLRAAP